EGKQTQHTLIAVSSLPHLYPPHQRGWKHYSTAPPCGDEHEAQPDPEMLKHRTVPGGTDWTAMLE
ncbi:hypothetical protein KUCAC02_004527, partial [Chaenocephalus aceratus]